MVVISKAVLKALSKKYPDAEIALEKWYKETKAASWENFTEVKRAFNTVDSVGNDGYVLI